MTYVYLKFQNKPEILLNEKMRNSPQKSCNPSSGLYFSLTKPISIDIINSEEASGGIFLSSLHSCAEAYFSSRLLHVSAFRGNKGTCSCRLLGQKAYLEPSTYRYPAFIAL